MTQTMIDIKEFFIKKTTEECSTKLCMIKKKLKEWEQKQTSYAMNAALQDKINYTNRNGDKKKT